MPLVIDCVLIDCADLEAMTTFWCAALDLEHVWTGPSGGHLLVATDGSNRRLGLMPSVAAKTSKNRSTSTFDPTISWPRCSGSRDSEPDGSTSAKRTSPGW